MKAPHRNRALEREGLDLGTVNLDRSDQVAALVTGVGGLRPSAGLRGEFRDVPVRFKQRDGKPVDELAQEIAAAQGGDPKEIQDKILEGLKRRHQVFGEQHKMAPVSTPPADVDVDPEEWRRMSAKERTAAVAFFRAGTEAPAAGSGVHRPRVRVEKQAFTLGAHSPCKGRVTEVNCRECERGSNSTGSGWLVVGVLALGLALIRPREPASSSAP